MSQSATDALTLTPLDGLPLTVDFQGGRLTSDGGWVLVAEADTDLGLSETLSAAVPDHRHRRGRHSLHDLLRQRLYQITAGYADQNDADTLHRDPLLKVVCGRLPERDPNLNSQRTPSRFENSFSARDCYRLAKALARCTCASGNAPASPPIFRAIWTAPMIRCMETRKASPITAINGSTCITRCRH